jgi:hypothetical protein
MEHQSKHEPSDGVGGKERGGNHKYGYAKDEDVSFRRGANEKRNKEAAEKTHHPDHDV